MEHEKHEENGYNWEPMRSTMRGRYFTYYLSEGGCVGGCRYWITIDDLTGTTVSEHGFNNPAEAKSFAETHNRTSA